MCPLVRLACLVVPLAFVTPFAIGDSPKHSGGAGGQEPKSTRSEAPADAKALYDQNKVWTIHLTFTADQWTAIEPTRRSPPRDLFGGQGGPQNGGRAAELLTPVVMSLADVDRDGRVSAAEFAALGQTWFRSWAKSNTGKLTEAEFRAGFDALRIPVGGGMNLIGPEGKRNGIASVFGVEYEYVHADLEFEGRTVKDVAVRYKGNGTFLELGNSPKRSFKIDLDKYHKGTRLGGVATLNLQNTITDPSWMNEPLAYRLFRDAGVSAPRTAYARVYVTVAGQFDRRYFGLYGLSENVDQQFMATHFAVKKQGAIFKPVTPQLFADLGADWAAYNQMYDPKGKPTDEDKKAVMDLCRLVSRADDKEFAARIGDFIDLPELSRYLAVLVYLSDLDGILGPGQNLYLYRHPESGKFVFVPWDQDRSWGQFARASQDQRNRLSIRHPWQGEKLFFERLFKVEAFTRSYLSNLETFSTTIFDPDRIARQVDEVAVAIRPVVAEEPVASTERFDLAAAGKMIPPARRGGFGGGETQPIKPFVRVRTQSIRDQLAGKSDGLVLGRGFGPPPGRGGSRSELSMVLSGPLFRMVAQDKHSEMTEADLTRGFETLFQSWDTEKKGHLGYTKLRAAIEKSFAK